MRVTNTMMMQSTIRHLGQSLERLQRGQEQLATGRAILRPSDDPGGTTTAMNLRGELRATDQRSRALDDARTWLGMADASLSTGLDLLARVKQVTVQASNTGAIGPASRAALAAEVYAIRGELLGVANTQHLGRSIFAGTVAGPAYDASGSYLGDAGAVRREVAPDVTIDVNLTGEAIFGSGAAPEGDLFAVLERLATAISSGDPAAIAAEHAHLDAARERVATATGTVGARGSRLESIQWETERRRADLGESLSRLEDVDVAAAILEAKAHENAYTASLQVAARILPPSLVDFLR
jgi:flagellar hook-associated protein 3 FlgL